MGSQARARRRASLCCSIDYVRYRKKAAYVASFIYIPTPVTQTFLPHSVYDFPLGEHTKYWAPKPTKHEAKRLCIGIPTHWGQAVYLRPQPLHPYRTQLPTRYERILPQSDLVGFASGCQLGRDDGMASLMDVVFRDRDWIYSPTL